MRVTICCLLALSFWCLPASAQLPNDTCATPTPVSGAVPFSVGFNSAGAGTEPGFDVSGTTNPSAAICAPVWFADPIVADVWFVYTAVNSQTLIATCGTSFDTKLEVYDGCPQTAANLVACNDDFCGVQSQLVAITTPGTDYLIRIGGWQGSAVPAGPGTLTIDGFTPAPNDECTTATPLGAGPSTIMFDNSNATTGTFQIGPNPLCTNWSGADMAFDIWYEFTASAASTQVDVCGGGTLADTMLEVYSACPPGAATLLACDDDGCGTLQSSTTLPTVPGTNYFVRVGSWDGASQGTPGDGTLTITPLADPVANLACSITGAAPDTYDITFDWPASAVAGDTVEISSDEPGAVNPIATLTFAGGTTRTFPGTLLGPNQGTSIVVNFDVVFVQGVAISPPESCGLSFAPAAGDDCGVANLLPAGDQVVFYDLTTATPSPEGDPTTCGQPTTFNEDLWYEWEATSGLVQMTVTSAAPMDDDVIALYDDCAQAAAVNPIACNDGGVDAEILAQVVPGQMYRIRVGLDGGMVGPATLTITSITPLPNDDCTAPTALSGTVSVPFDNTIAFNNGPDFTTLNGLCTNWTQPNTPDEIFGDLYYTYTPDPGVTEISVSTCQAAGLGDTRIAVYGSTTCPPDTATLLACDDDGCAVQALQAELTMPVTPGITYLVQIGSWSTVTRGIGTLTIGPNCGDLGGFAVAFDCVTNVATLSWTENDNYSGLSLTANGTPTATQPTAVGTGNTNTFTDMPPLGIDVTYELTATCANGATSVVSVTVNTTVPGGADNLIIDAELADDIDSGAALETAILANSATVQRITDLAHPCLTDLINSATNIWVMLGTFPADATLPQSVGDLLYDAVQNNGKNVYLEGGDHWAFDPASSFDDIDGVDDALVVDGDDDLDRLVASNATTGGLDLTTTFPQPRVYNQANLGGNDWTDELALATGVGADPDLTSAEVIWRNNPGPNIGIETDFIVGVASVTTSTQRTICVSWEFGGLGAVAVGPTASADLAGLYLNYFGGGSDPKFQRGDCNSDNAKNIADPVRLLNFLFPANPPPTPLNCDDSCDANDDGGLNIADAVAMLNVLFPTGPPVPWIAPDACGIDPTMDGLDCVNYVDGTGALWCP
ncbi:MAG: hypothetical protein AAF581_01475 [Planctomycetota bacterium]